MTYTEKEKEFETRLIRLLKTKKEFEQPLKDLREKLKEHFNCDEFNKLLVCEKESKS